MDGVEFLELALASSVGAEDIRVLIADANRRRLSSGGDGEGLTYDFKSGQMLAHGQPKAMDKKHRDDIRHTLFGFANAGGGVVIVGVRDPKESAHASGRQPLSLDGVPADAPPIDDWVSGLMNSVLHQVHSYPVTSQVSVDGVTVWLVAIPRHEGPLLYLTRGHSAVFPMRIGDSTVDLHTHLVNDLLVGRRAVPAFSIACNVAYLGQVRTGGTLIQWECDVQLTNESMVYADDVVVTLVAQHLEGQQRISPMSSGRTPDRTPISKPLRDRIQASNPCESSFAAMGTIPAFGIKQVKMASFLAGYDLD